jgi:hypothetical protein
MNFYFNIGMDFTYVEKYCTLVCFHPFGVLEIWLIELDDPTFVLAIKELNLPSITNMHNKNQQKINEFIFSVYP